MPSVEGDDIKETEPFNKVNVDPYVGDTGVSALPSISFMGSTCVTFRRMHFLAGKVVRITTLIQIKGFQKVLQGELVKRKL